MTTLRLGDRSEEVRILQHSLKQKNYTVSTDSVFGPKTELAVKKFQLDNKLYSDGIVGKKTWVALGKKDLTPVQPPPINGAVGRQNVAGLRLSTSGLKALYKVESWAGVSNHLHWPKGSSGVTLGAGYDLRYRNADEVKSKLVAIGIDSNTATKVADGVGKHGKDAGDFAKLNHDLVNLTSTQETELLKLTVPAYELMVRNKITAPLTQYEFDALVSFAYNPGGVLDIVANFINTGRIGEAMAQIKRIVYSGGTKMGGLIDRRNQEVNMYLEGKY